MIMHTSPAIAVILLSSAAVASMSEFSGTPTSVSEKNTPRLLGGEIMSPYAEASVAAGSMKMGGGTTGRLTHGALRALNNDGSRSRAASERSYRSSASVGTTGGQEAQFSEALLQLKEVSTVFEGAKKLLAILDSKPSEFLNSRTSSERLEQYKASLGSWHKEHFEAIEKFSLLVGLAYKNQEGLKKNKITDTSDGYTLCKELTRDMLLTILGVKKGIDKERRTQYVMKIYQEKDEANKKWQVFFDGIKSMFFVLVERNELAGREDLLREESAVWAQVEVLNATASKETVDRQALVNALSEEVYTDLMKNESLGCASIKVSELASWKQLEARRDCEKIWKGLSDTRVPANFADICRVWCINKNPAELVKIPYPEMKRLWADQSVSADFSAFFEWLSSETKEVRSFCCAGIDKLVDVLKMDDKQAEQRWADHIATRPVVKKIFAWGSEKAEETLAYFYRDQVPTPAEKLWNLYREQLVASFKKAGSLGSLWCAR